MPERSLICPACSRAFGPEATECPECGQGLVEQAELRLDATGPGDELVVFGRLESKWEERSLAELFESRRLPLSVRGNGELLCPPSREEEASRLLGEARLGAEPILAEGEFISPPPEGEPAPPAKEAAVEEESIERDGLDEALARTARQLERRKRRPFTNPIGRLEAVTRRVVRLVGATLQAMIFVPLSLQWLQHGNLGWSRYYALYLLFLGIHGLTQAHRDVRISWKGITQRLWIPPPIPYRHIPAVEVKKIRVHPAGAHFWSSTPGTWMVEAHTTRGVVILSQGHESRKSAAAIRERAALVLGCDGG